MFTEFFRPSDQTRAITETTFSIEKKLTANFSVFTEYVGDYPQGDSPSQLWNSGGVYHLDNLNQLDFHVAIGLNHNAPSYIAGAGYSFRIDGLFGAVTEVAPDRPGRSWRSIIPAPVLALAALWRPVDA